MPQHEQFGRPPTLRPRSAASGRSPGIPDLVAARVNPTGGNSSNAIQMQLLERIQSPRSAVPCSMGSSSISSIAHTNLKPPMRPKSAALGNRHVSRQRLERAQTKSAEPSNQGVPATAQSIMKTDPTTSASITPPTMLSVLPSQQMVTRINVSAARKRPSSAAVSTRNVEPAYQQSSNNCSKYFSAISRGSAKRPCSAGPTNVHRPHINVRVADSEEPQQDLHHSASTEYRNTFVYAVPRHCLNPRLRYNPYDIVTVSRTALFETNQATGETTSVKWDYYTISASGFTFYPKNDTCSGTFHSTAEWEIQRKHFDEIAGKPTFELFRYRKVFIAWKKWVRTSKMEAARVNLLVEGYFSHPPLFRALVTIKNQLRTLDTAQFEWDFRGASLSLTEFNQANQMYLDQYANMVQEVHAGIQSTLVSAIQQFLLDQQSRKIESSLLGDEFARSSRKSNNYRLYEQHVERELKLVKADIRHMNHEHFGEVNENQRPHTATSGLRRASGNVEDLSRIRWTLAAIQRRKCRQLARFAQLVAFLELDTFEAVVQRNAEMVFHSLLRGTNSTVIRKITHRHTYEETIRTMDQDVRCEAKIGKPQSNSACELTVQQLKRLIRSVWEIALHSESPYRTAVEGRHESTFSTPDVSSEIWDQSKFETAFLDALSTRRAQIAGKSSFHTDKFSIEEVLSVAGTTVSQALVLQMFHNNLDDLYCSEVPVIDDRDALENQDNALNTSFEAKLRSIPSIAPTPLFNITLELSHADHQNFQIGTKPSLDEIVDTVHGVILRFLELFTRILPISAHPTLKAVLRFAEDLQISKLFFEEDEIKDPVSSVFAVITDSASAAEDPSDSLSEMSTYCRLDDRMRANRSYQSTCTDIYRLADHTMKCVNTLAEWYNIFLEQHGQNLKVNFEEKARLFRSEAYSLDMIADDIRNYQGQIHALERLQPIHNVQFISVGVRELTIDLLPAPTKCLDTMHSMLPVLAYEKCTQLLDFVSSSSEKIQKPVCVDLVEFTRYLVRLQDVYDAIDEQESSLTFVQDLFSLLDRFLIHVPEETARIFELCDPEFSALRSHAQDAYSSRESDIGGYSGLLNERIASLQQSTRDLRMRASDESELDEESYSESLNTIVSLERQAAQMTEQSGMLVWAKSVFADISSAVMPPTDEFAELFELSADLKLKVELWTVLCEASSHMQSASCQTLQTVELSQMVAFCERIAAVISRVREDGTDSFVLGRLQGTQRIFEALAPIIRDLRNPQMKERHWTKLERKMDCSLTTQKTSDTTNEASLRLTLPLQHLIDVNAAAHATEIRHVSEEATAEAAVADGFDSVVHTWETKEIPIEIRKDRDGRDTFSLGDCDELFALLEESEVLLRVMDFSSYARSIQERLTKLLCDLELTKTAMDLLQVCQHRWDHTQKLSSADFVRSFPEQARLLQRLDTSWRTFMAGLSKRSLCLSFGVSAEARQILQDLVKGFEVSAKALTEHLEMKRQVFPPFFRLSNTELATLLSKARDVHDIQSYLHLCFDNVSRIVFGTRESFQDIHYIISRASYGQPESIDMGTNLKARGPPEQWLSTVEKRLCERLRRSTKLAVSLLTHFKVGCADPKPSDWVQFEELPLQSVLLADQIVRGTLITECLNPCKDVEITSHTQTTYSVMQSILKTYAERLLRYVGCNSSSRNQRLQPVMSKKAMLLISCLRLHDIQFRDAMELHYHQQPAENVDAHSNSATNSSIPWDLQVRYSLDDANIVGQECNVQLGTLRVPYGFNYVDPAQGYQITLQSMRTLFALSAAIRNGQGTFLTGRRDSGTNGLATQVSTIIGRRLFNTITTATTTYAHVSRLLIGALFSGGVFSLKMNNTSDVTIGIVKLIATHFSIVQQAVLSGSPIEGIYRSGIAFTPGTTLMISLNHSRIPQFSVEEIRQWAEPISVFEVAPNDPGIVLEANLFVNNFAEPDALSKRLVNVRYLVASIENTEVGAAWIGLVELFSMKVLRGIIEEVGDRIRLSSDEFERAALESFLIREAVIVHVQQHIKSTSLCDVVINIVDSVFGNSLDRDEWFVKRFLREELELAKKYKLRFRGSDSSCL